MTDKLDQIIEFIKNKTKCNCYNIKIEPEGKPTIFDSKIGGLPYWTKDKEYPKSLDGNKLFLLAQINFDKCNVDEPLPNSGLLQFFISDDDEMGMDFDNQTSQNKFRVIYHEKIDYNITEESIKEADIPNSISDGECFPVSSEHLLTFEKRVDYMSPNDYRFDNLFSEAYKEAYGKEMPEDKKYYFKVLNEKENDKLYNELTNGGNNVNHRMLGYPFFTQTDPRSENKFSEFDTLLLQIDSDEYVMWGDVGVCNFFIEKDALIKKDFSNILFNWDCC
eukprot:jgi/Orpsp1_1/1175910/evm.model.c7180000055696.1